MRNCYEGYQNEMYELWGESEITINARSCCTWEISGEHFENCCSNFVLGGANVRGMFRDFNTPTEKIQGFTNIKRMYVGI